MLMRVSVGIHGEDLDSAIETYNYLSEKWFTHASPTLFNAATRRPQLSRLVLVPKDYVKVKLTTLCYSYYDTNDGHFVYPKVLQDEKS